MDETTPFEFKQCISILKATGRKAKSLRELRHIISEVNEESIFHHTYRFFLKGHAHEYTNDFAHWAGENLGERALSEHLSNIDPYDFISIGDIKDELLRVIDGYLDVFPESRETMPGDEFYFNQTITFVFPTGIRAQNLADFLMAIKLVGGIPLQIIDGITGFLVHSSEGAAFRIRQLLNNSEMAERMGEKGKEHVRNNFLITRQIRDYLSVWYSMENKGRAVLEL